ncbi:hypothetical protein CC86DRAFT_406125 [Ophiobolus disseminans]|uniref:Uncharacterized protein n=1 Tax=Ophiobolus disseminans TaxID=1469910 RepID=A0A6A7A193_9PLEO|nr:hypothetical protein CC86DRAFT_406125 [Ophiobolus disseminans]
MTPKKTQTKTSTAQTETDREVCCNSRGGSDVSLKQSKIELRSDDDTEVTPDIIVQLRPEGVSVSSAPDEEISDQFCSTTPRVSFKDEQDVTSAPTDSSDDASYQQFVNDCIALIDDSEDELKVLEHSLPSRSSDPQSIEYTQEAITVARQAIVEARSSKGYDEDLVYTVCERIKQARDLHEEALRRVNGPTHFELLKHAVAMRTQSDAIARHCNASAAPEDCFDDVQNVEGNAKGGELEEACAAG